MYIEIIKDTKSFKELKPDWEFLEKENINTEIFQTFNYNFFWWETIKVKKNIELNIFVVKENDGTIIAIAPFCIKTEKKNYYIENFRIFSLGRLQRNCHQK